MVMILIPSSGSCPNPWVLTLGVNPAGRSKVTPFKGACLISARSAGGNSARHSAASAIARAFIARVAFVAPKLAGDCNGMNMLSLCWEALRRQDKKTNSRGGWRAMCCRAQREDCPPDTEGKANSGGYNAPRSAIGEDEHADIAKDYSSSLNSPRICCVGIGDRLPIASSKIRFRQNWRNLLRRTTLLL